MESAETFVHPHRICIFLHFHLFPSSWRGPPLARCRALLCVTALRCAITALWRGDTTGSHCEARSLVPSGAENYLLASNCRPSDCCSKSSSDRQTDTVSSIIILMKWNLYVYFIVFEGGGVVLVVGFIGWYES
jgi:hypothetical protein